MNNKLNLDKQGEEQNESVTFIFFILKPHFLKTKHI